jgi:cellobiose-specific phosphotransferase system component IIC
MEKSRWIIAGVLGGIIYAWLVAFTLAGTFAIAWPEWYQAFAEEWSSPGLVLWHVAMGLPALLFALIIGFALTRAVGKSALSAAFVGAASSLTYVVSSSVGSGWISMDTFIIVGLLPLSVFVLALHNRSLDADAGAA